MATNWRPCRRQAHQPPLSTSATRPAQRHLHLPRPAPLPPPQNASPRSAAAPAISTKPRQPRSSADLVLAKSLFGLTSSAVEMMQVGAAPCNVDRFGVVFRPSPHHTDCVTFAANKLCSDIRNSGSVDCHSNCNRSTSQVSLFLCSDSTNRRNGLLGGPLCVNPSGRRNLVGPASYSVETSAYDVAALEPPTHVAEEKVGVLLLNLGGPETLNDVQPFLFNLFADPDIIRLPRLFRFLQRPLAKLISVLRAPKSKEGYAAIGGGSPLRKITDDQALAIKKALETKGLSSNVYVGMRYWYPFTEEAIQQIKRDRITRLVVLPLYPQFSISTTGSSVRVLEQAFREDAYLSTLPVSIINSWYQREAYIKSMADLIEKELQSFSEPKEAMIFFSAHGVPVSYVEDAGDPYRDQMEECIFLIIQELKARGVSNEHTLAYQSRVGPVQWLKPYTDEVLVELGKKGVRSLLAVPVSFVSEHIETLEEIDMEYKELALESGIKNWARVPALGLTPSFITDLADAVIEALPSAKAMYPRISTSEDVDHDPVKYFIKLFFGSFLAFILFLSPKMIMAFRNHVI